MFRPGGAFPSRFARFALAAWGAAWLGVVAAAAQAPAPGAGSPPPAESAPAAPASETPPAPSPAPAVPSDGLVPPPLVDPKNVQTQTPPAAPGEAEPFVAQEMTLSPLPVVTKPGNAAWDEGFDKITATMRDVLTELSRLGLERAGDMFVVYTQSDDAGFDYEVQVPFSGVTTGKPMGDMSLGGSYSGKVLRFVHTGAFADMDNTYEQIANYLDSKNLEADNTYIEQYRTDPLTTPPDQLTIDILIPLR